MLFEQSEISVINIDDDSAANMMGAAKREVVKYSVLQPIQYAAKDLELTHEKTKFSVEIDGRDLHIEVPIPGYFTVYNAMAAVVTANAAGIDNYCIEQGLKNMKPVAGRFEPLDTHGHDFSIILDYAHTPDSLKNALDTAKSFAPARVVTIFGCGGNRDSSKRALWGRSLGERSDFTIITSDNPRFEEPAAIMAQIEEGMRADGWKIHLY